MAWGFLLGKEEFLSCLLRDYGAMDHCLASFIHHQHVIIHRRASGAREWNNLGEGEGALALGAGLTQNNTIEVALVGGWVLLAMTVGRT